MKIHIFFTLMLLALVPDLLLAEQPTVANLREQIIVLTETVKDIKEELALTRSELSTAKADLDLIKANTVLELDGLLGRTQDAHGYDTALFRGVNVQVVNGVGATNSVNGLGNLVIGYNASSAASVNRLGSHNLVLGDEQSYPNTEAVVTERIVSNTDLAINVSNNMSTVVGSNQGTTIGASQAVTVGKDLTETIGGDRSAVVGADSLESIGRSATIAVGGNASIDVGDNMSVNGGKDMAFSAGENMNVSVAKELVLGGGDELHILSGGASGLFKKNGAIAIDGKDIAIKASGSLILKGSIISEN